MADLLLAGRWLLAVVLVAAGAAKLRRHGRDQLITAIENYGVPAGAVSGLLATLLPWWELAVGVMLAAGVLVVCAAVAAALTLGVFAAVVCWHVWRGHRFGCGCGTGAQIGWGLAGRDLLLASVALAVTVGPSGALAALPGWDARTVDGSWQASLPVPLAVIVLSAGWRLARTARSARIWLEKGRGRKVAG